MEAAAEKQDFDLDFFALYWKLHFIKNIKTRYTFQNDSWTKNACVFSSVCNYVNVRVHTQTNLFKRKKNWKGVAKVLTFFLLKMLFSCKIDRILI